MNKYEIDKIPSTTLDLIRYLEELYPDTYNTNPTYVGTPEFWKEAGKIELIRMLKEKIQ